MGLIFKNVKKAGRSMYLYYPDVKRHNPYIVRLLTVLRNDDSKESAQKLLDGGLAALAEEKSLVLAFPNPAAGGWNYELKEDGPDDIAAIEALLSEVTKEDDDPLKTNAIGIPELSEMLRQWHLMALMRYMIGTDAESSSMAYAYAAVNPAEVSAVCGFGGELSKNAKEKAKFVPTTALLTKAGKEAVEYFVKANGCTKKDENPNRIIHINETNPYSYVVEGRGESADINSLILKAYDMTFSKVRRINTGKIGDMTCYTDLTGDEFTWFINDKRLGDMCHTWLVHVPKDVKAGDKVPLVMFYHGGSDNPSEAADMAKLHELGRKEKFITVYPWGSNTASWNINYDEAPGDEGGCGDEKYCMLLIDYMIANYPVDAERVYVSGFSNGAAMAQVVAMLYPEKIAGLFHIDSNWPGNRWKPVELDINEIPAMRRALQQKKPEMRMPVWYTYGTREASCPVYKGCTQQYQYDFWKKFNNITVKETAAPGTPDAYESGVAGDKVEKLYPSTMYPEQYYAVNRFYSNDPDHENLYNYVLMHDKGHEVATMDPVLGWEYVKHFRRKADGSLEKI